MEPIKVALTEEKQTLLPTLYGKALDARDKQPILNDTFADSVVRHIDYDFSKLKLPRDAAVTLPIRAKHLDGWTREFLRDSPNSTVLHLGCGLDSRVFRIDPPATVRWYDVDHPEVIALRKRLYPEPKNYALIGTNVTDLKWLDEIPIDRAVLVVAEGLVQYLPEAEGMALFRHITEKFPNGQLIFDAYSRLMIRMVERMAALRTMGVKLSWGLDDPQEIERHIPRLKLVSDVSFLTMPELVSRLSHSTIQRTLFKLMGQLPFLRHAVRHLRYRFPA